jgi:hypothetical protein
MLLKIIVGNSSIAFMIYFTYILILKGLNPVVFTLLLIIAGVVIPFQIISIKEFIHEKDVRTRRVRLLAIVLSLLIPVMIILYQAKNYQSSLNSRRYYLNGH